MKLRIHEIMSAENPVLKSITPVMTWHSALINAAVIF